MPAHIRLAIALLVCAGVFASGLDAASTAYRTRSEWLAAVGLTTALTVVDFEELTAPQGPHFQITSKGVTFRLLQGATGGNGIFILPQAAPGYGSTTGKFLLGANDNFYHGAISVTFPGGVTAFGMDLWRYCPTCGGVNLNIRVYTVEGDFNTTVVSTDERNFLGIVSTSPIFRADLTGSYVVLDNIEFNTIPPNLTVTNVTSWLPSSPGGTLTVQDTVRNAAGTAAATTNGYYLSLTPIRTTSSIQLTGGRNVPALDQSAANTGTATPTVPLTTPEGDYYVIACADEGRVVQESNEDDNCRATGGTIRITPCPQLERQSDRIAGAGGNKTLNVIQGTCAWTATSNRSWVTFTSGASGSGPGVISYSVRPNLTDQERVAEITVGTSKLTLTQDPGWQRVLDPNPQLLQDGTTVTVRNDPRAIVGLSTDYVRAGVATDGVSKLLLAVKSARPLRFYFGSGVADGTLECLTGGTMPVCSPGTSGSAGPDLVVATYQAPSYIGNSGPRTVTINVCDPDDCRDTSWWSGSTLRPASAGMTAGNA